MGHWWLGHPDCRIPGTCSGSMLSRGQAACTLCRLAAKTQERTLIKGWRRDGSGGRVERVARTWPRLFCILWISLKQLQGPPRWMGEGGRRSGRPWVARQAPSGSHSSPGGDPGPLREAVTVLWVRRAGASFFRCSASLVLRGLLGGGPRQQKAVFVLM